MREAENCITARRCKGEREEAVVFEQRNDGEEGEKGEITVGGERYCSYSFAARRCITKRSCRTLSSTRESACIILPTCTSRAAQSYKRT